MVATSKNFLPRRIVMDNLFVVFVKPNEKTNAAIILSMSSLCNTAVYDIFYSDFLYDFNIIQLCLVFVKK